METRMMTYHKSPSRSNHGRALPPLDASGFIGPWRQHSPSNEPPCPHEIGTAIAYLSLLKPTTKPTEGSYGLKHSAEWWGGLNRHSPYVSNGALIAAAILCGLRVEVSRSGINALIGVSARDVSELDEVMGRGLLPRIPRAMWLRWRTKTFCPLPRMMLPREEW
jgi:hypothetical protein